MFHSCSIQKLEMVPSMKFEMVPWMKVKQQTLNTFTHSAKPSQFSIYGILYSLLKSGYQGIAFMLISSYNVYLC